MIYSASHSALSLPFNRSLTRSLSALLLTLWLLPSPLLQAQTAAAEQDIRTLELGKPIERELAADQFPHVYQITLAEGQYLNVVVEQRGIDVAVALYGPDGLQILLRDADIAKNGQETLAQVVEVTGIYEVKVLSKKQDAVGRYEIRIVELRPATRQDRILQEVRDLYKNFLGLVAKGKREEARLLAERVLSIRENILGPNHPELVAPLTSIASSYNVEGDYGKAESLYRRALGILEESLGSNHPGLVPYLDRLADHYFFYERNLDKAEPLFQRALTIQENVLGTDHLNLTNRLDTLALLYERKLDYGKAEPLYQRALAIREKVFKPTDPVIARSLDNLANLSYREGDYSKAELLYQRVLAIFEEAWGPDNSEVGRSLRTLAELYEAKGEIAQAVRFHLSASRVSEHALKILSKADEPLLLGELSRLSSETSQVISLHVRQATKDPVVRDLAVSLILQLKGRALEVMTDSIAVLRGRASTQDQALLDQLKETNEELAKLVLSGPQGTTTDEHQERIKNLEKQKMKFETGIRGLSAEFRAQVQPVTIASVQAVVPADAALIEFFVYRPFDAKNKFGKQFGAPRYVAYMLRRESEVQWVELGEAKAINEAVGKLRQALRDKTRRDVKQLAREVDRLVMQPIRPLLGMMRHIFISPDGALNLIPFGALVNEQGRYLIEDFEFGYLTSGRDLLRLHEQQQNKQGAMVIANPDFGETGGKAAKTTRLLKPRPNAAKTTTDSAVLAGYYFPPLPRTAQEAVALKALLPNAKVLTQGQATETALKQVHSPAILHIATHGFFLEDQGKEKSDDRLLRQLGSEADAPLSVPIANPLLRSGLALAGANRLKSGDDDGILTAQEAAGLDLWGTKLVVLSACDTGVGEVKNGEGVYGLRRALVLAGSQTQVMSLWPVSDLATRDLMIGYYRRLLAGEGRTAALRRVQLQMLNSGNQRDDGSSRRLVTKNQSNNPARDGGKKDHSHPYYWASFIQSGEWANLEGKRENK